MIDEICDFLNGRNGFLCAAYYDDDYMETPKITYNGKTMEVYSFATAYENGVISFSVETETIEALPAERLSKSDIHNLLHYCNEIESLERNS